jgi:hypothetical protein
MSALYKSGDVGHCGLGGSPDAAAMKAATVGVDRAKVLGVIDGAGPAGISGDRVAATLGWLPFRVRPRTSDLRKAGLIFDSQRREKNANGISCIVWVSRAHAGPVRIGEGVQHG